MNKDTQKKLLDIVKENYEEIAEDFSETRKKYLWPELIKLASQVKGGDSVLDAGCGNGRLIEAFKDKKINYIGVDSSGKLIELAREKYGPQDFRFQISDFRFLVGDILELDKFINQKFDYIFCVAVLHHIPGENLRLKVLENLKNRLSDNGKIIFTVWNLWSRPKFRRLIFKFWALKLIGKNHRLGGTGKMDFGDILFDWKNSKGEAVSKRYYHAFSQRELKNLIKKLDLNIIKLYKDKYNYYVVLK